MAEGGLKQPKRKTIPWDDPAFYDEKDFEKELRRVADICHSCRLCFNLCTSFPKLFDAIDASASGEVDGLSRKDFDPVIDACTLCDMCFMATCPYVPPHPFDVDFPHLMLRARAIASKKKQTGFVANQLTQTDRNGRLATKVSKPVNWATGTQNKVVRNITEKVTGIDRHAHLPPFEEGAFHDVVTVPKPNPKAPAFGAQVALFSTCLATYNDHALGRAALAVLAHNGVQVHLTYDGCCGMPRFEQGHVAEVAANALRLTQTLLPFAKKGMSILSLVPSCTLMMAHEWPLLHPENQDIEHVAKAVTDIASYLVALEKKPGLMPGLETIDGGVQLHMACHSRAQNKGRMAEKLLKHIPKTPVQVIERCSGHGGSWGIFKENFDDALKVGKPVFRAVSTNTEAKTVTSECPLAAAHIKQGIDLMNATPPADGKETAEQPAADKHVEHPIQTMARAWGLDF